ncbi:MAG TPA: hypothetical protein DCM26_04190, partial [Desulfotomaculum sp.]|nr:hypothetical protein [Desulfotomaculum sp.]
MDNPGAFSLEEFCLAYLVRAGAVVEKAGHALLEVLAPEELFPYFNHNHLFLAFDYEVARETPESIFITYGSQLLDTIIRLASFYGRYTKHYWPGNVPAFLRNMEQPVKKAIEFVHCRPPRLDMQWVAEHAFYAFSFRAAYHSFEKTDQIFSVVIDGFNGLVQQNFLKQWENIVPGESPGYACPGATILPLDTIYQIACREVETKVVEKGALLRRLTQAAKNRELVKINCYYEETAREIQQKMDGADEGKEARLEKQLAAVIADQERRQKDAARRYEVEAEVRLDHLIVYHMPCLHAKLEVQHKNQYFYQTVVYNPLTARIEAPACPLCGKPAHRLVPAGKGQLACLE